MNFTQKECIFKDMKNDNDLEKVKERIEGSHRFVAILFTDIVDSTEHWDKSGDITGRMVLDRHNRILFPVIKKYRGRVIKTIGDSIMASFISTDKAIQAAIACQQVIKKERKENKSFKLHIRIGLHCGTALVEKKDVFGDVVNISARVEAEASVDQILISSTLYAKLKRKGYRLTRYRSFVPKGKTKKMMLYRCNWKKVPKDYGKKVKSQSAGKLKLWEVLLLTIIFISGLNLLLNSYIYNFIIELGYSPIRNISLISYLKNPTTIIITTLILSLLYNIKDKKFIRPISPVLISLTFGIGLWAILYGSSSLLDIKQEKFNRVVFEGSNYIVKIQSNDYLYQSIENNRGIDTVEAVHEGDLLILSEVEKRNGWRWNRVITDNGKFWVEGYRPQKLRPTPTWHISRAYKFYFYLSDFVILVISLLFTISVFIYRKIRRSHYSPL